MSEAATRDAIGARAGHREPGPKFVQAPRRFCRFAAFKRASARPFKGSLKRAGTCLVFNGQKFPERGNEAGLGAWTTSMGIAPFGGEHACPTTKGGSFFLACMPKKKEAPFFLACIKKGFNVPL